MQVQTAGLSDIDSLTELRLAYLREDSGEFPGADAVAAALPGYFREHLDRDLFAYVLRDGGRIASCALLVVTVKPMSPAFPNGRTGTVLNVYTRPEYRRRGHSRAVMQALLDGAKAMGLSALDLKATQDGYPLYRSLGFRDDAGKYRPMRFMLPPG